MTLSELLKSDRILFECRSGSYAYGTNTAKSDEDIRGLFLQTFEELAGLNEIPQQISDERNDITYFSLRRYIELASEANPNILELLYMPDDCIRKTTPAFEELKLNRGIFISRKCIQTHQAYAMAQIKKARGRNKWINNPQPERRPSIQESAWYIPNPDDSDMPYRPVKFSETNDCKQELRCSSVEHCPGLYRLYRSDKKARLFTEDSVVCSSIPKEEELTHYLGLLYVNIDAFKRALNDHRNYWAWIKNRNINRWQQQENGKLDYDAKNMQHTIRLIMVAENIIDTGQPIVRFENEKLELLRSIREGNHSYDDLIKMAEEISGRVEDKAPNCDLPEEADKQKVNKLFIELTTKLLA
jgi:hypothetical protein